MIEIKKLPQELINQIAAGEVIERPASVVKELIDNSIDAGSTTIKIKVVNGGMKLIEISDNGVGIDKEMLPVAFEAHSTSKVSSLEDLNNLMTMGFRGEALSTIVSISQLDAISRTEDSSEAYKIVFESIEPKGIEVAARDQGTTISIRNLFANIPARLKYLKSADTEYRKILEVLLPYFILRSDIHFILEKDGNEVYNLPATDGEETQDEAIRSNLSLSRIKQVLKGEYTKDMIQLFYDGSGMKIDGYVSHPSHHAKRSKSMFLFVNGRPVTDRGIYRSVLEGFGRFIPHGEQIPYVINLQINPELVDVNVHPRKEEVRFLNPFRVYSAVEKAVSDALMKNVKDGYVPMQEVISSGMDNNSVAVSRLRTNEDQYSSSSPRELDFRKKPGLFQIESSMEFSKNILEDRGGEYISTEPQDEVAPVKEMIVNAFQMFKKYLFIEFESEMWVVDQHAAAERITFERLLSNYEGGTTDVQSLLVPIQLELEESELLYLKENIEFFKKIGFEIEIEKDIANVKSLPVEFVGASLEEAFKSIFELSEDNRDLQRNFDKAREDVLATVACHNSIRTNQRLEKEECISLLLQLLECKNPYSCPHGRPIVWKMGLSEVDSYFDRTY